MCADAPPGHSGPLSTNAAHASGASQPSQKRSREVRQPAPHYRLAGAHRQDEHVVMRRPCRNQWPVRQGPRTGPWTRAAPHRTGDAHVPAQHGAVLVEGKRRAVWAVAVPPPRRNRSPGSARSRSATRNSCTGTCAPASRGRAGADRHHTLKDHYRRRARENPDKAAALATAAAADLL